MKTYNTIAIETDINGVDSNEELAALFAKALELSQTAKTSQGNCSSPSNTQFLSYQNVTYCIYNAASVDLQPIPLLESGAPHNVYTQNCQENEYKKVSTVNNDCNKLGKTDDEEGLHNHGSEEKLRCFVCDELCVSQEAFDEHTKTHKEEESRDQFKKHLKKNSKDVGVLDESAGSEDDEALQEARMTEHSMGENPTFGRREEEAPSMLVQENIKQGKDTSQKLKKNQSTKRDRTTFVCTHCEKVFTQKGSYQKHVRSHTVSITRQFICSYCNKAFPWISALQVHVRTHTKETPFPCQHCEKEFAIASALKDHVIRRHFGEKPHKCSVCEKAFVKRWELTEHQRTHTGERPFKCEYCGKSFLRKPHLAVHLKIHTGERPHKCEFCNKGFVRKRDLVEHLRIHTGERPHQCEVCDKAFLRKTHLAQHMKTHTGTKRTHQCEYCIATFTKIGDLQQHLQEHA